MTEQRSREGRDAASPWNMPLAAWRQVIVRAFKEAGADNVGLVAAGVGFYAFLALVPLLGAVVLTYGLAADPETVVRNMQALTRVMPQDIAQLIGQQLLTVVHTSGGKKGLGLLVALAVALFGARNAAGAIITALNIAYEEEESRGFIRVNLLALAMTAAAVIALVLVLLSIAVMGWFRSIAPGAGPMAAALGKLATYALLALGAAFAAATLYRYGPARDDAKWTWLTPGSVLFALSWILLTAGFGFYVSRFGNYGATYGSLGAVVVLLTWLYLSSYALVFGAELNSELEHQTVRDTTKGPERPLGERGAWAADHVAQGTAAGKKQCEPG